MNDVLRLFLDDFVIVYLDDILNFSKTWEEHLKHVKQTLDVLKREKLHVKLSKRVFGKTSLNYLGHIVGGGELKIYPSKVAVIVNWPKPKSATEVRSFLEAAQYRRKFISNFSLITPPLHALTRLNKVFQWGGKQQKAFDTLKEKISKTHVLALPDLKRPFEIQTDANDYAMGAVLTQHGKTICYHSEIFNPAVVNYPTYDKELYALVQSVKKWKHYLMGKEIVIHTDHQPLQYLHSQTKLQQSRHYRWMGFLQQFHLVIRYKKGIHNKVTDMLSRSIINASTILKHNSVLRESYIEQYAQDIDVKDVYVTLSQGKRVEELDYHIKDQFLYHCGKLCIPQTERVKIIREAHTSLISCHFGHAYNRAKHYSTQIFPFETCFGFTPKSLLDFVFGKNTTIEGHSDVDKATRFIKQIQEIHQAVQEQLEKSQAKYKARHDKHRMEHSFQVGDQVWLYISEDRMQGEGKKLKPIRYGPFKILEKIGENDFHLDLPAYMHIYSVVNVDCLRLFEPSLI
eukprot:PITA_32598